MLWLELGLAYLAGMLTVCLIALGGMHVLRKRMAPQGRTVTVSGSGSIPMRKT